jgi:ribose 5-phosphate isomerase B
MKIAFGSDHRGVALKSTLIELANALDIRAIDFGTYSTEAVDYPDVTKKVTEAVITGEVDGGVLICGTGLGMSIAANKVKGIRAALCYSEEVAELSRLHNNANVICFGADFMNVDDVKSMLKKWINTPFKGGRHQRRIEKIEEIEGK